MGLGFKGSADAIILRFKTQIHWAHLINICTLTTCGVDERIIIAQGRHVECRPAAHAVFDVQQRFPAVSYQLHHRTDNTCFISKMRIQRVVLEQNLPP